MPGTEFKKIFLGVSSVILLAFTSCQTSQQLMQPRLSMKPADKNPVFLDDITLGGNATNIRIKAGNPLGKNKPVNPSESNVLQHKYAAMLQVVPNAITNLSLYSFIEDWYGVKYRFGGNDKSGIDCSAFVQRAYETVFCTNLLRTAFQQFHSCRFVLDKDSLKEGDLVFFRTRGKRISHVGIYLMNNYFVHASTSQGVMISSLDEAYWTRYYAGAGSILHMGNSM